MEHLRCVVERITYQNEENGYTVLKCAVKTIVTGNSGWYYAGYPCGFCPVFRRFLENGCKIRQAVLHRAV